MLELYYCITDEIDYSFFETYLKGLPEDIQKEVTKYKFIKDQKLTLCGKWMLASFFKQKQIPFYWADWKRNRFGKPFLPYGPYFNISHCHGLVVAAFCEEVVGIDIERVSAKNLNLVSWLHPNEQCYINGSMNKEAAFCEIWTKKEAYLKAKGWGLHQELNTFDCSMNYLCDRTGTWNFTVLRLFDHSLCSVCTLEQKQKRKLLPFLCSMPGMSLSK